MLIIKNSMKIYSSLIELMTEPTIPECEYILLKGVSKQLEEVAKSRIYYANEGQIGGNNETYDN